MLWLEHMSTSQVANKGVNAWWTYVQVTTFRQTWAQEEVVHAITKVASLTALGDQFTGVIESQSCLDLTKLICKFAVPIAIDIAATLTGVSVIKSGQSFLSAPPRG